MGLKLTRLLQDRIGVQQTASVYLLTGTSTSIYLFFYDDPKTFLMIKFVISEMQLASYTLIKNFVTKKVCEMC